jgi:aminoglycoside 6'-N-acetyltransferase I
MPIEIHRLSRANAALLDQVAPEVFDHAIDPGRLAAYLAEPGHLMVLAVEAGLVVGQCAAVIHRHPDQPTELYIDNLGVAPDFKRRGIASKMVDEMFAWGRSLGCEEAWVGTEPDNVEGRGFYESRNAQAIPIVMYEYGV